MSTVALLDELCPVFSDRADRGNWLTRAATKLDASVYGVQYAEAVCWLAAHYLELRRRAEAGLAGAGAISAQTNPEQGAVSFAVPPINPKAPSLSTTPFGLAYLDIKGAVSRTGPILLDGTNPL